MVIFPFDVWCNFLFQDALGMSIVVILDLTKSKFRL